MALGGSLTWKLLASENCIISSVSGEDAEGWGVEGISSSSAQNAQASQQAGPAGLGTLGAKTQGLFLLDWGPHVSASREEWKELLEQPLENCSGSTKALLCCGRILVWLAALRMWSSSALQIVKTTVFLWTEPEVLHSKWSLCKDGSDPLAAPTVNTANASAASRYL